MQIVINIDDELYEQITVKKEYYLEDGESLCTAVANGIPLPKDHGRLIDASYKVSSDGRTIDTVCGYIAPTIIYGTNNNRNK